MSSPSTPLLVLDDLRTDIELRSSTVHALSGIDLEVRANETLGIVGESGSGKTMTALSVMGLLPQGGRIASGSIRLAGRPLESLPQKEVRRLRGTEIGMIFQDPLTSLNPTMKIGRQVAEPLVIHEGMSKKDAMARAIETLKRVGMPRPESVATSYPHQLSGGMRQRVMIAMALVCRPRLLIADEPTTALDVTTQKQILDLIDELRDEYAMGVILITHDLGVVAGHTDRVAVMYGGRIVETAPTAQLFANPRHRYTTSLLAALPERALATGERLFSIPGAPPSLTEPPIGCRFAERCMWTTPECSASYPPATELGDHAFSCFHPSPAEGTAEESPLIRIEETPEQAETVASDRVEILDVVEASKSYPAGPRGFFGRSAGTVSAVDRVSIAVKRGETYGLVGESGCGKSTVGRLIAGLEATSSGEIRVLGTDLARLQGKARKTIHRDVQMMFQDSYAAMDPRMRIEEILSEPLAIQKAMPRAEIGEKIEEILHQVGLPVEALDRYPHEFSGGQLQRIGFARALALEPDLIVADEPVSALDVSVQAQVLNLMKDLQAELGLSYIFISHDLAVVQYMADRIGVMYLGRIVEEGPAREVIAAPRHPYTRALIDSIPVPDPSFERSRDAVRLTGEPPSAINPPEGCRFRTRCPFAGEECGIQPFLTGEPGEHRVACHHPLELSAPVQDIIVSD
ncbi:ABC transporter ATP-binding protein [Schaalia hyovaginalis]|uniref:ABC transporter ATP-binding protein n=1 Tax=Schaalia hyovaginalis TaxID=29316 RepID=UPI0012B2D4E2|nr:ABC transporter ATP-binding protein [Schaalia hyovaginalis]MST64201.1 ABC transporter ATP-binding protein [Schaalia hyovaginalis]